MFKKKLETGRSMVEMLGVLAIIGVLSIGGIAGYTLSMRRYRANQMLDALNKYALVAYSSCQKALIDGKIPDITRCGSVAQQTNSIVPSFADSNIGSIGEASSVYFSGISQKDNGEEMVHIHVSFYDSADMLCQTMNNVMGLTGKTSIGTCGNNDFPFLFK